MDARTALKNYTRMMIKTYGDDYWEYWTEDDKETFNILAARVRPEITPIDKDKRSNFTRRFLGMRVGGVERPAERKEAWTEAARTANEKSRIKGVLGPDKGLYKGTQPKRRRTREELSMVAGASIKVGDGKRKTRKPKEEIVRPVEPQFAPDDVDSQNIYVYLRSTIG